MRTTGAMRTTGRVFFISVPPIQPLGTTGQEQTSAGDTCVGSPPTAPSYTRAAIRATLLPTQTATRESLFGLRVARKKKADPSPPGGPLMTEFAHAGGYAPHFMASVFRVFAQSR